MDMITSLNDILIPIVAVGAIAFFALALWKVYAPHIEAIRKKRKKREQEAKTPARVFDEEYGKLAKETD